MKSQPTLWPAESRTSISAQTAHHPQHQLMLSPSHCSLLMPSAAKSLQSCPTLCDPIDGNPPGSPIPGSLQARTLEWVAISFSNAWKWTVKVKSLSRVWLLASPCTAAYQAPPPMGFSRQEYWSGCHRLLRWTTNWDTKYLMGHVMLSIQTKLICNHITDSYMEWSNKQCSI